MKPHSSSDWSLRNGLAGPWSETGCAVGCGKLSGGINMRFERVFGLCWWRARPRPARLPRRSKKSGGSWRGARTLFGFRHPRKTEICVVLGAPLSYAPDDGLARSFPHSRLPMDPLAAALVARRTDNGLPVLSDLLRLFS